MMCTWAQECCREYIEVALNSDGANWYSGNLAAPPRALPTKALTHWHLWLCHMEVGRTLVLSQSTYTPPQLALAYQVTSAVWRLAGRLPSRLLIQNTHHLSLIQLRLHSIWKPLACRGASGTLYLARFVFRNNPKPLIKAVPQQHPSPNQSCVHGQSLTLIKAVSTSEAHNPA
jgi:hypothetical protein